MTYELFYGTGGHGGPYHSYDEAKSRAIALLKGSASEVSITIRFRDANGVSGYGDISGRLSKDRDGAITHQRGLMPKEYVG
jgi:hypothetical protein